MGVWARATSTTRLRSILFPTQGVSIRHHRRGWAVALAVWPNVTDVIGTCHLVFRYFLFELTRVSPHLPRPTLGKLFIPCQFPSFSFHDSSIKETSSPCLLVLGEVDSQSIEIQAKQPSLLPVKKDLPSISHCYQNINHIIRPK